MAAPHASVAVLTPPGRGAVASLEVFGQGATEIVASLVRLNRRRPLGEVPIGRVVLGRWSEPPHEEVVLCRTGTDRIAVHCHGGSAVVEGLVASLDKAGCRVVHWTDWLAREVDDPLARAAAVALAAAPTERTAAILWDQAQGALGRALDELVAAIHSGAAIDAIEMLDRLLSRSSLGQHLTEPWRVVLTGRPNVGKSSLINAILGYERAIVLDQPGTTRDVVTAVTALDGWPVELSDTAGVAVAADDLDAAAAHRAAEQLARADLVIIVLDSSVPRAGPDRDLLARWPEALVVISKCDLPPASSDDQPPAVRTSATMGIGLDDFITAICRRLVPEPPPPGDAVPLDEAQADSLRVVRNALESGDTQTAAELVRAVRAGTSHEVNRAALQNRGKLEG